MHPHKNQLIVGAIVVAALLVLLAALLRPSRPVVVSSRPGETRTDTAKGNDSSGPGDRNSGSGTAPGTSRLSTGEGGSATAGVSDGTTTKTEGNVGSPQEPFPGLVASGPPKEGTTDTMALVLPGNDDGNQESGSASDQADTSGESDGSTRKRPGSDSSSSKTGVAETEETPAPGEALVGGRVMQGDEPVGGARLSLTGGGRTFRAGSNSEGVYQFPPIEAGQYVLQLVNPTSPSSTRILNVAPDDRLLSEDFTIPLGPAVRGQVIGYGSNEGVSGANIQVFSGERYVTALTSGTGGAFETPPLVPGEYEFQVKASGYQFHVESVDVPETDEAELPPIQIVLDPANTIEGVVVTPGGGPAIGARVALFTAGGVSSWSDPLKLIDSVVTNGSGQYRFTSVPPIEGAFQVGAWREGMIGAFSPALSLSEATRDVLPPIQLLAGMPVTGHVVESEGQPLEGVTVAVPTREAFPRTGRILERFNAPLPQTTTGANGMFRLEGLEEASIRVDITKDGYIPQHPTVDVTPPSVDLGEIRLESDREGKEGTIYGQITDELYKDYPRSNCTLRRVGGGNPASYFQVTDEKGSFVFNEVQQGEYILDVGTHTTRENNIYIPLNQTLEGLEPGQPALRVIFDLGGAVNLKVVDGGGNPVRRFRVNAASRGGWPGAGAGVPSVIAAGYNTIVEKSTGEATIKYLIPGGTADITVTADNLGVAKATGIPVPPDGVGDAGTITVGEGGSIEGRVLDTNSQPVAGLSVDCTSPSNPAVQATTGSGGSYRASPLSPGTYTLEVRGKNYIPVRRAGITVEQGETIEMPEIVVSEGGTISGTVYQPDGVQVAASVVVKCGEVSTQSDSGGRFLLQGVASGPQKLTANDFYGSTSYAEMDVNVMAGETLTLDIVLQAR